MRFYSYLVLILLLASNATAECRDKDCMPEKFIAYSSGMHSLSLHSADALPAKSKITTK